MTHRERFVTALEGGTPPGRVPTFELVFFLTMEAFGRVHPSQRHYGQWNQMSETERDLHRRDLADLYLQTARTYDHSAIFYHGCGGWDDDDGEMHRILGHLRDETGDEYFLTCHGDATYAIPDGERLMEFVMDIADRPQEIKDQAGRQVDHALARARSLKAEGLIDGFCLCSDYCFNDGPFLSPAMMDEFVFPYLKQLIAGYREMGYYVIKHTDGNIMPILDSLVDCNPHALHSLDPQGGVDLAEVKRLVGDQVCLIGNVNCGALQTGSEQEVIDSVRYALRSGAPGGGYIFSTSNCVYTGMPLDRYDLMLSIWREEGGRAG